MTDRTAEGRDRRPPSGCFGRAAFGRDVADRSPGRRPTWWNDPAQRERRYAEWVEAEAYGLLAQLGRLEAPDMAPELAAGLRTLKSAMAADAAWATAWRARPAGPETEEPRREAA